MKIFHKLECIPVGCVPHAAVANRGGGGGSASEHAGIHRPNVGLETPPRCGPGDPPTAPGDLQGMLGYHPRVNRILDTRF